MVKPSFGKQVYRNALVVHHIRLGPRTDICAHTLTSQKAFQYQIKVVECQGEFRLSLFGEQGLMRLSGTVIFDFKEFVFVKEDCRLAPGSIRLGGLLDPIAACRHT